MSGEDWGSSSEDKRPWGRSTNFAPDSPSGASSDSPGSSVKSPPTPLPHTPLFSPRDLTCQSSVNTEEESDDSPDLPFALAQAGWRKFWSKREGKSYYFNKLTQQSQWDLPKTPIRKRPSSGSIDEVVPYKKFIPSSDWDLTVSSNVLIQERVPLAMFPPHPVNEEKRLAEILVLKKSFQELCALPHGLEWPQDCVNHWILERQIDEEGRDPVLPSQNSVVVSPCMVRDLLSCVPIRLHSVSNVADARRQVGRYAEACKRLAESVRGISPENRKRVKWQCEAMFDWLRHSLHNSKLDEYLNRVKFLRTQCRAVLADALQPSLELISTKLMKQSKDMAASLEEEQKEFFTAKGIEITEQELPPPRPDKIVPCYSCQLRFSTPPMPQVIMEQTPDKWVRLRYQSISMKLNAAHFFKLEQLYRTNCFDDKRFDLFLGRVWTMLRRYQAIQGPGQNEGWAIQKALPVSVLEVLRKELSVTFEAFASPLTSYFRQFCSPFPDTDGYFGSRGPFLRFQPLAGSFVVNPPHIDEILVSTVRHILSLLNESETEGRPLSFCIFLPESQDSTSETHDLIMKEAGPFFARKASLPANEHFYRSGGQQWIQKREELIIPSSHGTVIYWLHNSEGASKWPVTNEGVKKTIDAFKTR